MPNMEHFMILQRGIQAWNKWRWEHRGEVRPEFDVIPDLSGASLVGMDLNEIDLRRANLRRAKLSRANLSRADLSEADLSLADLSRASLNGADLFGATLTKAILIDTDLNEAIVAHTQFADVDLSGVKGIETIKHEGPSTIGIDTVYRSRGNIPKIFLRGAGVPDNFIEYMDSLVGEAWEYYSCFISYSSKDQGFADQLYVDLQTERVRCWLATEDLKIGEKFRQRIDEAVRVHDRVLVVLSESSINSTWVESEVEAALERERAQKGQLVLFPIRLDDAILETGQAWASEIRRIRHIGDFRNWQDHNSYKRVFQRLLRDLQGEKGKKQWPL